MLMPAPFEPCAGQGVLTLQGTMPRETTALANERVQCNAAGQVVLKLKTAWRDGTRQRGIGPA